MPIPYSGPTSAQFRPTLGAPQFDGQVIPLATYSEVSTVPHITYIIQDGDKLSDVARLLYGANTPQNSSKVLRNGFNPGDIHHVPISTS